MELVTIYNNELKTPTRHTISGVLFMYSFMKTNHLVAQYWSSLLNQRMGCRNHSFLMGLRSKNSVLSEP